MSVIIPAYNEAGVIGDLVSEIRTRHPQYEVLVVDDGSVDDTAAIAERAGATVIRHPYNIGNGAAVKNGIRQASGDVIVLMDGDGQHRPQDIQQLAGYADRYDLVVATRSRSGQASPLRFLGNKLLNLLAAYVTKFPVRDLTSGFRVIRADIARNLLQLLPNTYSYPTTITLGVLRSGYSVKYLPVDILPRTSGHSNIKMAKDGVRFFMIITKICTLYSPMRIFLPVSFAMFMTGMLNYLYTYVVWSRFTNMSALLLTSAVMIFMMGLVSEQICQMRFERREVFSRGVRRMKKDSRNRK